MDKRLYDLEQWLIKDCNLGSFSLRSLPGDASFRRYFRVKTNQSNYIAMDAPKATENCHSYIAIAQAFRNIGLHTPIIIKSCLEQGFLLITDFGDALYLKKLTPINAEYLYGRALDALSVLQNCREIPGYSLPLFTPELMRQELELFKEWFLAKHKGIILTAPLEKQLALTFDFLIQSAAQQYQVCMHRDFHSANLMVLANDEVGILDFQDAFIGPVTYDLVSLLRDCYISWPEDLIIQLVLQYREKLNLLCIEEEEFLRWFDLMGLQRHMKALLTFARKYHRDNNANYLQHIPRTLKYIAQVSQRYSECEPLYQLILEVEVA